MTVFQFWMIWLQIVHFYNLHSNKMATFTMEFGYTVHCVQLLGYLMSVFSILICCTRISVRDFHERYLYRGPYQGFESIVDRTRKSSSPFLKYQKVIFWQWIHEWKGSFFWHGNNLQYQDINTKLILLDSLEIKWLWLGFGIHAYNFQLYLKSYLGFCAIRNGVFTSTIPISDWVTTMPNLLVSSSTMVFYSGNF